MFFTRLENKTDEQLMSLVQQGNSKAMTLLYRRYASLLLRYFFRMLWKKEVLAQDFLHDLFLKVIERADQFKTSQRFSTWLYSAAHNMCKNEYRKQAFRKAVHDLPENETSPENIHDDLVQKEFREALDDALKDLDENDRNLFVLRHELEMTVEEIAGLVNIPQGTVKSKLFYMKKKLAAQLHMFHMTDE
jgi:RNA polymerase sigma-70 factor (ECF subfamily)